MYIPPSSFQYLHGAVTHGFALSLTDVDAAARVVAQDIQPQRSHTSGCREVLCKNVIAFICFRQSSRSFHHIISSSSIVGGGEEQVTGK